MGRFENGAGEGDGWIKPMPRHTNVPILSIYPVNLHPVNEAVAWSAGDVGKHQLPGGDRSRSAQLKTTNGTLNARALRCFQLLGLIIQNRLQPFDKAVQGPAQLNENFLESRSSRSNVIACRVQTRLDIIGTLGIGNAAINRVAQMHEKGLGWPCRLEI